LAKNFDVKITSITGLTTLNTLKVKKGTLYLALKSATDKGFFKLSINFFNYTDEVPQSKLLLGRKGALGYEAYEDGQAKISFSPIKCTTCDEFEAKYSYVNYIIHTAYD